MPTIATDFASAAAPHLATSDVKFQRVLLAIDFSAQTSAVIEAGLQIAKEFHSELFFLHATMPMIYGTGAETIPVETFGVELEAAQTRMAEFVAGQPHLKSLPHHEIVRYGRPLDLIQQVIEEHRIDLVLVGSHGASGMERLALGSVAECILRTVRCPVLIVGPKARVSPEMFRSILLAASLSDSGLRSAQYAASLAEHFGSRLTLLHVIDPARNHRPVQPEVLEQQVIQELLQLVPEDFARHATAVPRVEYGKAADLISSSAVSTRTTLLVTGARNDNPLADHSLRAILGELIRRSPCPVLTVRGHVIQRTSSVAGA
ncbi:MAG TPA: universal stress protein [Acidobacteriaceae bacterium]|jgi:nucleotide-binding universal stress UspA family protein